MSLDPAIAAVLHIDPSSASVSSTGGAGMSSATTSKITATLPSGETKTYFLKTGTGPEAKIMFEGEHGSLAAISSIVPNLCPKPHGYGQLQQSPNKSFLLTDYLDLSSSRSNPTGPSLAQKLAKLHTTPAPIPSSHTTPQYGFPVPTCCGDTPQSNTFTPSWADFYANHRLRFIGRQATQRNGADAELTSLIETTCTTVVPRLLDADHLQGLRPVVVHGDLWSGNASVGKLPGMDGAEAVVFDSSACYAHSEYELGIMRMFGGFGGEFLREYHRLVPKSEPAEEYEDRVALYELYHHLNHHALFGGGYRGGAVGIMKKLIEKYGGEKL